MSLNSPLVLNLLSSWLTCFDLCALRILNRWFLNEVPRQTKELTVYNLTNLSFMKQLCKIFPHVWRLRIQDAFLHEPTPMKSLVPWLNQLSELKELELIKITCVSGFDANLLTKEITKVTIQHCYQVQEPTIISSSIDTLIIQHCPVFQFHINTSLPQLKKLSLSSRNLTTLQCQNLITKLLSKSPLLEYFNLTGCSQLEEIVLEIRDIPALRQFDLSACSMLHRVHLSSECIETLLLSPNLNLQYVNLDLKSIVNLDVSFLKNLTHLSIHSPSLQHLNLRGCDQLKRETTNLNCPNLHSIVLQGTKLTLDDLSKPGL
ncbi:uncharacterized protein PHALS_11705 [Plasmopara halstedii]|uniref:Uncharacterized protein n=1 Tax=Plasmopara halstedii TaxID=4781 RepID=A0A0N7L5F8_PLAHL|nr:uncharacterized protein PHALS_11705 [Plasmopara halstedii]CEG41355.1 hypothetical protein PHALS_11705 [Plasmopara halstedii]|eukprot:XP_024577724.1 hypothetical protein PHALS_11705 [Plasmopara halstedii]